MTDAARLRPANKVLQRTKPTGALRAPSGLRRCNTDTLGRREIRTRYAGPRWGRRRLKSRDSRDWRGRNGLGRRATQHRRASPATCSGERRRSADLVQRGRRMLTPVPDRVRINSGLAVLPAGATLRASAQIFSAAELLASYPRLRALLRSWRAAVVNYHGSGLPLLPASLRPTRDLPASETTTSCETASALPNKPLQQTGLSRRLRRRSGARSSTPVRWAGDGSAYQCAFAGAIS